MREVNNERNSRKRLNALILLVAFTAILLIVSTYAWFSTQKNVTLSGLHGQVNVAEGLQVSLDALNWANQIDLSNNAQAYFAQTNTQNNWTDDGTTTEDDISDDKVSLLNPWKTEDGDAWGRTNFIPSELLPVSTTAQQNEGIGLTDLNMYRGENTEGIKLSSITNMTTDATGAEKGFYAIDLFLQNSSSETAITGHTNDLLRLETNSSIVLDTTSKESTGLQNTLRVAFAIFDEDTDLANQTLVSNTPSQSQILEATTGAERKITDVAIWEPNANGAQQTNGDPSPVVTKYAAHVDYIVQNNNKVTFSEADQGTYSIPATNKFTAEMKLPTYALTSASTGTINNIYDWDTGATAAGLVKQNTVTTDNSGTISAPVQLKSVKDGTTDFSIAPGKYIHMRMYVWLEGQDVDCINYASLGGGLTINVGLSKPGTADDGDEEEP